MSSHNGHNNFRSQGETEWQQSSRMSIVEDCLQVHVIIVEDSAEGPHPPGEVLHEQTRITTLKLIKHWKIKRVASNAFGL